jgi:hypothetical protein
MLNLATMKATGFISYIRKISKISAEAFLILVMISDWINLIFLLNSHK